MNVFGCFDGCLYALAYSDLNDNDVSQSIDLVKISLSNGQHVWEPTNNYEIIERGHFYSADFYALYWKNVVCWQPSPVKRKDDIILLDLETLEWKYTNIEFDYISSIGADSSQTLMVSTRCNDPSKHNIYRFVVNQPDKLSNLVWLRLKRVFNARPAAYKFILSQLPTNFKQKCPFSRSRNHNLTKEIVNTEKQIEEHYRVVGENDDQFRAEKKVEIEELRSCN
ncbi:hypothetical protein M3Y95_00899900 [Aphelenchoides besseyi]|nr:hypothetical protein M3Y95_00899900 [Aphelenchoides besseyi]